MIMRSVLIAGIVLAALVQFSCEGPTGPSSQQAKTTVASGIVVRSDNNSAVPGTFVFDISGQPRDTTSNSGAFSLSYSLTSRRSTSLIASRPGFKNDTLAVTMDPGVNLTNVTLTLVADSASPPTSSYSGKGGSIFLVSAPDQSISLRGTGGNESATMIFEVRDSLGFAITAANATMVYFALQGGPGGGEYVFPSSATTDQTGRVTAKINSGTRAGVVQVFATAIIDTTTIISRPVSVNIAGGFPVLSGFSVSVEKFNMPAVIDNVENRITASLGDRFGNPLKGTSVYFGTTSGRIDAGGRTDNDGIISVTLRTSGVRPPSGIATVTASTVDSAGTTISRSVPIVFSGATQVIAPSATFVLPDSGVYGFNYRVQDAAGNPLSEGTRISVTVSGDGAGDLEVIGDKDINVPDTQSPSYTTFNAAVRDKRTGGASGTVAIKISVQSTNGNVDYLIPGIVLGSGSSVFIPPSLRQPAQIEASSPSATAIDVAGVGGFETSVVTFTVKDSAGVAFDASKRIFVAFTLEFVPNSLVGGGTTPLLLPSSDSTDNGGRVRATIISGTQAGVAQVVATVTTPSGPLIARSKGVVVRAGDPNRAHFNFYTDAFTFATVPGNVGPNFFVQAADTFSNPVSSKRIYFHTWAGNIQAEGTTDAIGRATVFFLGGNPTPDATGTALAGRQTFYVRPGVLWVISETTGKDGVPILDSLRVCWAIGPITVTGVPGAAVNVPRGSTSGPISLTITDGRNNPLPVGTTISVSIDFTSDVAGVKFAVSGGLTSDFPFEMPNGPYVVDPGTGITDFTFKVSDLSTGGGATLGQTMIVRITITAPNIGSTTVSFNAVIA